MSDPTQATASALTGFAAFEATLSADWQAFLAFIKNEEAKIGAVLNAIAAGEPVLLADVQAAAGAIAGKVSTISAAAASLGSVATTLDPASATTVNKLLDDTNVALADAAALSTALSSGASASDPEIVTKTVSVIGAVNTLSQLAGAAGAALTAAVQSAPGATTVVSPPTPAAD